MLKLFPDHNETILGTVQDLRAGRRTCEQVLDQCLANIDEWEQRVKAWVMIDRDGARARARELDADLKAHQWRGPLHGIPIGIKDLIDVAGWPTAAGWPRWKDRIAAEDATIVKRLRAAGAVILGKTVTTQFACFDPPETRNPWNLDRTPGGSSSGSAAAVATGMCLGAIGSQTGGSITRPASFCGVCGCKPRRFDVCVKGIVPLAPSMDHPGPMARWVHDLAILLDVVYGFSEEPFPDTYNRFVHPRVFESLHSVACDRTTPRLGRLRGMFESRADDAARGSFDRSLVQLAQAGAEIIEIALPPSFAEVLEHHRTIMAVQAAGEHGSVFEAHGQEMKPRIRELIEDGIATPAVQFIRSWKHREELHDEFAACFTDVDVLFTPATTTPAPDTSTTGDPAFNSPWSYTGLPTVSIPSDLSPEGLPLAIQLIGGRGRVEYAPLFRAAAWCEEVLRRSQ